MTPTVRGWGFPDFALPGTCLSLRNDLLSPVTHIEQHAIGLHAHLKKNEAKTEEKQKMQYNDTVW